MNVIYVGIPLGLVFSSLISTLSAKVPSCYKVWAETILNIKIKINLNVSWEGGTIDFITSDLICRLTGAGVTRLLWTLSALSWTINNARLTARWVSIYQRFWRNCEVNSRKTVIVRVGPGPVGRIQSFIIIVSCSQHWGLPVISQTASGKEIKIYFTFNIRWKC